jgi:hypothetical protein
VRDICDWVVLLLRGVMPSFDKHEERDWTEGWIHHGAVMLMRCWSCRAQLEDCHDQLDDCGLGGNRVGIRAGERLLDVLEGINGYKYQLLFLPPVVLSSTSSHEQASQGYSKRISNNPSVPLSS